MTIIPVCYEIGPLDWTPRFKYQGYQLRSCFRDIGRDMTATENMLRKTSARAYNT